MPGVDAQQQQASAQQHGRGMSFNAESFAQVTGVTRHAAGRARCFAWFNTEGLPYE
jgi:hypothetical protein